MSETPVTLELLAERITSLADAMKNGFDAVDKRFDAVGKRFDEQKSSLRTQLEAVDAKVSLVLEKVEDLILKDMRNSATHAKFDERFDNHERRLKVLESRDR